jgi:VIT1/CCC1 family predicted Fe2+/Mn2+ transporter
MADDVVPPDVDELSVLRGMLARLRAGERLDSHGVERALEAGFGALMGLEAELARAQRAGATGERPETHAAAMADLKARIDELREALTDLRTLAVAPGEARVGYGFVLPGERHGRHAHDN